MAIIITENCRVFFMMPCPACGDLFNKGKGVFVMSETLGDKVLVCENHSEQKSLSVEEEVEVQNSLKRTMENKKGWVSSGQKIMKKTALMEKYAIK